jgi:type IV secretory pathway TraG/TraD family ATPase VirD4
LKTIRLTREQEESHAIIVGDIGTGKSQSIYQYLDYIQRIGDVAVVLDSQREFIQTHHNEARGDWVLNPKDERCPFWNIFDEGTDEADFTAVVESLFPPMPGAATETNHIFHIWVSGLAAYLLSHYRQDRFLGRDATTADFGDWMVSPKQIHKRIKGSEHEATLNPKAAPQYAGILGTFNTAGKPLRMMPREQGKRRRFSAREYAANPAGAWIFVTNTQATRDALRPLQSMWLDLLILRRLSLGKQPGPRVWFLFDELKSLHTLPQMQKGVAEGRKTANPIVLGMQNIGQGEELYGKTGIRTLFSQAFTKFIFAVTEPESAKYLSEFIGEVELRKYRESRGGGRKNSTSFSGPEDVRRLLVMPSEIQGLPNLKGYMVQRPDEDTDDDGLHVVKFKMRYQKRQNIAPGEIERMIPMIEHIPDDEEEEPVTITAAVQMQAQPAPLPTVMQPHVKSGGTRPLGVF